MTGNTMVATSYLPARLPGTHHPGPAAARRYQPGRDGGPPDSVTLTGPAAERADGREAFADRHVAVPGGTALLAGAAEPRRQARGC
jgi:hypothetical protein